MLIFFSEASLKKLIVGICRCSWIVLTYYGPYHGLYLDSKKCSFCKNIGNKFLNAKPYCLIIEKI